MLQYPKDANGIWVSLDTTAMYRKNGNQFHVSDFFYEAKADLKRIVDYRNSRMFGSPIYVHTLTCKIQVSVTGVSSSKMNTALLQCVPIF